MNEKAYQKYLESTHLLMSKEEEKQFWRNQPLIEKIGSWALVLLVAPIMLLCMIYEKCEPK